GVDPSSLPAPSRKGKKWTTFATPAAGQSSRYRGLVFHRRSHLNEVGCEPERPRPSAERFHRLMVQRQAHHPLTLTATATHDTKRGEDARARLFALSADPERWI